MQFNTIRSSTALSLGSGKQKCNILVNINISIPMKIIIFHFNYYFITQRDLRLLSARLINTIKA